MEIISALNNREIAVAIWLSVVFLWTLSISSVRSSMLDLLKAFFAKQIVVPFAIMLVYVLLIVLIFQRVGFWDTSALKDTILWTIGTTFATFLSLNKVAGDRRFFRKAILDNIKLVLILEFIINLYSFNLILELVLLPIVTFMVMLNVVAESKPEYRPVGIFLDYVLGLFGVVLIVFTFREVFVDFQSVATLKTLRDFCLPPLFTIVLLPFVYLMALYLQYESIFTRMDSANENAILAKYAKQKIFGACHLNLAKLNKFSKNVGLPKLSGKDDVLVLVNKALNPTGG